MKLEIRKTVLRNGLTVLYNDKYNMETIDNPIMNNLRRLFKILEEKKIKFSKEKVWITYQGESIRATIFSFPIPQESRIDKDGIYNIPVFLK